MKRRFDCPVGLSDHSGSVYPGYAAIARGADLLEVHVTFHKAMFGPDVPASLTFDELAESCQYARRLRHHEPQPGRQGPSGV